VIVPTDVTCRFCGQRLRVRDGVALAGLTCPTCLGQLTPDAPAAPSPQPPFQPALVPDADVRADQRRMGCGLIGLAILGGLGALSWGWGALIGLAHGELEALIVLAPLAVALLAIIVLPLAGDRPWARVTRRVLIRLFALGGLLILIAMAFVLFVFVSCLMGAYHPFR
jgi:hypothetical protein